MKYIGPFFRMNSLSQENIYGQLFHLSKEAIKTIALSSRCGIMSSFRSSKKNHPTKDISTLSNFSPLLCVYKKSSPSFIRSKENLGFDENTFKKTIVPFTNALFTLSILELSDYYSNYPRLCKNMPSMDKPYYLLSKKQLEFYSNNLRNYEGVFIERKNIGDNSVKECKIIDTEKGFKFPNQAFMMNAYFLFSMYYRDDSISNEYEDFASQILDMFINSKEELYNVSFEDGCLLLLCFNILYDYRQEDACKDLIIDLSDFMISKYESKDYLSSDITNTSLLALNLLESYKHTDIIYFKDKGEEIVNSLEGIYDSSNCIFTKTSNKKEIKYSADEICFYFLALLRYNPNTSNITHKNMITSIYKNLIVNSGIILSWPKAPTLDEAERYRKLSMHSSDMIEESFFRSDTIVDTNSKVANVFNKYITYSRKKKSFTSPKQSFDSEKNMLIFFYIIHYFRDYYSTQMGFLDSPTENSTTTDISIENNANIVNSIDISTTEDNIELPDNESNNSSSSICETINDNTN